MKKFLILSLCFLLSLTCVRASLPLTGKTIVLDIGHGGDDPGTSYQNVLEKDLNLAIGLELEKELSYYGGQIFYYGEKNKKLAEDLQSQFNKISYPRSIKPMPNIYMYRRLKIPGVLVECGFISNKKEREKLITPSYQKEIAKSLTKGLILYFT